MEEFEQERLEAARQLEEAMTKIKPLQSSFHFFMEDHKDMYVAEAKKEIKDSGGDENDPYLLYTNLNARLQKAWEDLSEGKRQGYREMEESDRVRYSEEEVIKSRHCATLTSRNAGPRTMSGKKSFANKRSPDDDDSGDEDESPPKKVKE